VLIPNPQPIPPALSTIPPSPSDDLTQISISFDQCPLIIIILPYPTNSIRINSHNPRNISYPLNLSLHLSPKCQSTPQTISSMIGIGSHSPQPKNSKITPFPPK